MRKSRCDVAALGVLRGFCSRKFARILERCGLRKIKMEKTARTTTPGYVNGNRQEVVTKSGPSESRTGQQVYRLRCGVCRFQYGSNGIDNEKRKCPQCQGGEAGERVREIDGPGLFENGAQPVKTAEEVEP